MRAPKRTRAEAFADGLLAQLIRRFERHGMALRPLGDAMLSVGSALLAAQLGPAGAAECLRRAADAAEEQIGP